MFSRLLLDYYKGFVVVTITGNRLPLLVNLANEAGLWIRDIVYRSNGSIQMTILRSDVRRLRPLLKQTKSKIHFGKRTGLPFLWQRAWRRKTFLAGSIVFLCFLYALTSVVWSIEVDGTKKLSPETILAAAESTGIHKGAWIGRLPDTALLQAEILDKVPELSWVGVSVEGTKVRIQVLEKIPPVQPAPNQPQHIVAGKKGVIERVLAEKGVVQVQPGQLVNPGEVVISGSLGDGRSAVHAKGIVEAKVWYTTRMQIPLEQGRKVYTGQSFKKKYFILGSFPIQVWGYGQNPYANSEEQAVDQEFHIGSFTFPVKVRHVDVKETVDDKIAFTEAEAKQEALRQAEADVTARIGGKGRITSQDILHVRIEHGKLDVEVFTEVIEDIGKPQPF
ncbi:sporulation protein YqfD [Effusibacillus consociatus]|uniref:Sporulation protein YqfD n=1 Tax=Effusibacillus consociatus TaxID=1117041 RepID=A0ABV9Q1X0_9BACL